MIFSSVFLTAFTTRQMAVVYNASKRDVVDQLERYVVRNDFSFKHANFEKGLYNINAGRTYYRGSSRVTTEVDSYSDDYDSDSNETEVTTRVDHNPSGYIEWGFSLEIIENPDGTIKLLGISRGGWFPGGIFKGFINHLRRNHIKVLTKKDLKKGLKGKKSEQKDVITQEKVKNSTETKRNEIKPDPPINLTLEMIKDLELITFGEFNADNSIDERLSLLELHYFNNQLSNLSTETRIKAIQNKMRSGRKALDKESD